MQLRFTSLDEYQFLTTLKHQVWGSKSARFKEWQEGDLLVFLVDKSIAGYAEITGKPYTSKQRIWENGVFPNRIPIKFVHAMVPENRLPILGEIRDVLISAWGAKYGFGILNQQAIKGESAEIIFNAIRERRNDLSDLVRLLDRYLEEAKFKQDTLDKAVALPQQKNKKEKNPTKVTKAGQKRPRELRERLDENATRAEKTIHARIQSALIKLGKIVGCQVWVASNDRNRKYHGYALGDGTLVKLPNFGLNEQAMNRIRLIDVIWIRQNSPLCAFEVEATTSVYSGLLRMSDLLAVVPALNIKLFIIASKEKKDKVMSELGRPTFRKIGLSDYCRFISADDLESLLAKVETLQGHLQPTILDTIALELESQLDSNLNQ